MKSLIDYIFESETKVSPTKEWMIEHYEKFNKLYFNNELPKQIELHVVKSSENWLGCQGETYCFYVDRDHMERGMYRMFRRSKGQKWTSKGRGGSWSDIVDEKTPIYSITELKPYIHLNSKYKFEPNEMEDTMIHEMIHLWTFKDGLAPLRAHGKEFKAKCKEIRDMANGNHGKNYHLTTYASDHSQYNVADTNEIEQQIIAQAKKGGGLWMLYFKLDDSIKTKSRNNQTDRFLFCTRWMAQKLANEIIDYHRRYASKAGKILEFKAIPDIYVDVCKKYGTFRNVRKYTYWDCAKYEGIFDFIKTDKAVNMLNENNLDDYINIMNEGKKPYVKPTISVMEIPAGLNLSDINIEDIVNGVYNNSEEDIKGSSENEKNAIDMD